MAVDVTEGRVFKVGTPKPLFQAPATSIQSRTAMTGWLGIVTLDGQRFLYFVDGVILGPAYRR
jgi:hypothetical protein